MIITSQVKAARMLLSWDQKTLAHASGLSLASVAALEQGRGSPRPSTWRAVQSALEQAGIEFTPDPGVRLRRQKFNFQIFEGRDSVLQVWRDIAGCFERAGGEVLLSGVDEKIWLARYREELGEEMRRRERLHITTRFLICEGDTLLVGSPEFYRAVPKYLFQQTPYYVYGDRLAIINWETPQTVLLIQNAAVAETFRRQFEFNWSIGRKLDPKKVAIATL